MKQGCISCVLVLLILGCRPDGAPVKQFPEEFKELDVMTFNVLYSTSNQSVVATIRESGADIIGLQEISKDRLATIAQSLKYDYHGFPETSANLSSQDTGILSRFEIVQVFTDGVVVQVNKNLKVAIFACHLSPYPYEPYDFRDGVITTAQQAVASASFRLEEINPVIAQINTLKSSGIPIFLTGDFNEPSHLDWTAETANANLHFNKVVAWPVSSAIASASLVDAWRNQLHNPVNFPGITWTPWESANEVYDRIDIIYHANTSALTLQDIRTVAGTGDGADITVAGYESDHYAVIATYKIN